MGDATKPLSLGATEPPASATGPPSVAAGRPPTAALAAGRKAAPEAAAAVAAGAAAAAAVAAVARPAAGGVDLASSTVQLTVTRETGGPGGWIPSPCPPPCRSATSTAPLAIALRSPPRGGRALRRLLLLLVTAVLTLTLGGPAALFPAAAAAAGAPPAPPPPIPYGMAKLRARYPQHRWDVAVQGSDKPRGATRASPPAIPFVRATSDADLMALYDENLDLDMAPWRRRNRSRITVSELVRWARALPFKASQRLIIIKGGKLGILGQRGGSQLRCERPCDPVMDSLVTDLRTWLSAAPASEPPWPDVAFFINVGDTSLCQSWEAAEGSAAAQSKQWPLWRPGQQAGAGVGSARQPLAAGGGGARGQPWEDRRQRRRTGYGPCPAPVLSLIKDWGKRKDEDILVPVTVGIKRLAAAPLSYFPPQHKIDAAVFRGREYCHTKLAPYAADTCSRTYFAAMSAFNPEWSRFMDVGFVENYTTRGSGATPQMIPAAGFVPTHELARFRYLLALDGITASFRLAQLLTFNSVVLKQTSPWIEWYYRSLVPGTHYISFWNHHRTDVLQVMKYLRHKTRYLQDVSLHGQAFAYRYLAPDARRLYWRRTLTEYGKLFADMDEFVASQAIPESEAADG